MNATYTAGDFAKAATAHRFDGRTADRTSSAPLLPWLDDRNVTWSDADMARFDWTPVITNPEWWGEDVTDRDGDIWYYVPSKDAYYCASESILVNPKRFAPVTPAEPHRTWRADGTGCTWDELLAVCAEGRRARVKYLYPGYATVTIEDALHRGGEEWRIGIHRLDRPIYRTVTVWGEPVKTMPDWWGAKVIETGRSLYIWDSEGEGYRLDGNKCYRPNTSPEHFKNIPVTVLVDAAGQWVGDQA